MKPRLIILSDLWEFSGSEWVHDYVNILESTFEIQTYDCCSLAEIDRSNLTESTIHNQFINGGVKNAVKKILEIETDKVSVLGFSVGGTIAWKAVLKGLNADKLYAVSSTRLRYETQKPNCLAKLYYGEHDRFRPNSNWFTKVLIKEKEDHLMYSEIDFINEICDEISNDLTVI